MKAEMFIDGIPVNPRLPKKFWSTDNARRPRSHTQWWDQPFVVVVRHDEWPHGFRYDTFCLDGRAWYRPTAWGKFATMEEAILCAKTGPVW
jgi:hypothetical protein